MPEAPGKVSAFIAEANQVESKSLNTRLSGRLMAIAANTFREAVRDKILYNLVLFVLMLIAGAIFLGELSAAQETKIIVDFGLSAMLLFGAFIAIFVGVGVVYKEIDRRTIYAIFSKPVGRGEFLIGKYLGMCLTIGVNVLIMGGGVSLALIFVHRGMDPLVWKIWPAILLIYFELAILTAVAVLFSTFSSPALSALMTFAVFIIGNFSVDLKAFASSMGSSSARLFFSGLYYLLPNFANYSYITPAAHGVSPEGRVVLMVILYAAVYVMFLLTLSTLIFNRRNFR
jgi:ABC-type transport system involved in multi-copper enzyme maturation permease subunit